MPHPLLQHDDTVAVDVYVRVPLDIVSKLKPRAAQIETEVNKQMVDEWEANIAENVGARKELLSFNEWLLSADCKKRVVAAGYAAADIHNPRTEAFRVPVKMRLALEQAYKDYSAEHRDARLRRKGRPPLPPRPINERRALSLAVYEVLLNNVK